MAKASELTKQAKAWVGIREGSKEHQELIDLYNSYLPHPRGHKATMKDSWCAITASCLGIKCNATDIIPVECSCEQFINLAKKMGIWIEDESITPKEGYFILYDWQDSGVGDAKGWADHIGYVEKVVDGVITVIEGNYSDKVKRRKIKVNAKNIRGYVAPKYEAEKEEVEVEPAKSYEKTYSREYTTITDLNLRAGAGTGKKIVTVLPKGAKVRCYGYYTVIGSNRWILVQYKGFTGYCSKKYVK